MRQHYILSYVNTITRTDELDKPFSNLMALQHWVFKEYANYNFNQIAQVIRDNMETL